MNLLNLTPHEITILNLDYSLTTVKPDGTVARVSVVENPVVRPAEFFSEFAPGALRCKAVTLTKGKIQGLPSPIPGRIIIVSAQVREAVPNRKDVASPGELVRNDKGQPIGCRGLVFNP